MNGLLSFSRLKLKTKLQLSFLVIGFLSVVGMSWQAFENARSTIETLTFERLTSIREIKKRQIESYFQQIHNQVVTLSEDRMIIEAMIRYKDAFYRIESDQRATFTWNVKPKTTDAVTQYWKVDEQYHPILESYRRRFGYSDIYFVDADSGYIVSSVMRKSDFTMNLLSGSFSETSLAKDFQNVINTGEANYVKLVDFTPYEVSDCKPVSFIASPIFSGSHKIGALIFQIPIGLVNEVMTSNNNWRAEGLGETGETYIVGADFTMRTDSRFFIQEPEQYFARLKRIGTNESLIKKIRTLNTSILLQEVRTQATQDALSGRTDTKIVNDYRGVPVISSYTPLKIPGVDWVMLSEIDVSEAFGSVLVLRERLILLGLVILLLSALIGFLISRTISKPILSLAQAADQFGKGNFSFRADARSSDEIGLLASEFNHMAESITQNTIQLQNEITERKHAEDEVRHSHQQLRNLSAHLQTVREEERKGLAREIHDELGQALTTLKLHLTVLKGDLQTTSAETSEKITPMLQVIDATIKSVKRMIVALRPRLLDDLGLTAAIEWQVEDFQQRTGIRCSLSISPSEFLLDADRSIAIFRIFQETLTNIARHAQASGVQIHLTQNSSHVELRVSDNGIGISDEQANNSASFGLTGMRERTSYWGGEAIITGSKQNGTTVTIRIPYEQQKRHD